MSRVRTRYICQECGQESFRWFGRCPSCGEWNTMQEEVMPDSRRDGRWDGHLNKPGARKNTVTPLCQIAEDPGKRMPTNVGEFDRVLGGGLVPGEVILAGGEPGIGKSTLLLEVADSVARSYGKVLYVSGEESPAQVAIRGRRMGATSRDLLVLAETDVTSIECEIRSVGPSMVVVDSVQTMYRPDLESLPGGVTQVRESAAYLARLAKELGFPLFLVGHVTKEGGLAGPKVLEHMTDCVLYFEGDRRTSFRVIRGIKNRFGSTNEIAVFEMTERGMSPVKNPSGIFVAERPLGQPGSAVVAALEGSRAILLEVQALVSPGAFGGTPRRLFTGVDHNRATIMLAVLEKRLGLRMQNFDVFVNVAGGFRTEEPAADLGICVAVVSSLRNRPVASDVVVAGEVGLAGEVRTVSRLGKRIAEAAGMGFKRCVVPRSSGDLAGMSSNLEICSVSNVREAIELCLGDNPHTNARSNGVPGQEVKG